MRIPEELLEPGPRALEALGDVLMLSPSNCDVYTAWCVLGEASSASHHLPVLFRRAELDASTLVVSGSWGRA